MNLTKALAAAAAALAVTAVAAPSQASTVIFASFDTGASSTNNFRFVKSGASATMYTTATGTATSPGAAAVRLTFKDDPAVADFLDLAAKFTFNGTVTNTPATFDGSTYKQTGISGNFKFIYAGPTTVIDGFALTQNVTTLFSGTFTNAWIQGNGRVGGIDVTVANGGSASFSSDFYDLSRFTPGTDEFTFALGSMTAPFGRSSASSALNSFRAHLDGDFQAAVPEPATWALMIAGFGGAGAMLRRQRRLAARAV